MIESKDIFTIAGPTSTGRPFLNENQMGALSTSSTFLADKRTLMNWIKRTAEAIGILRQISVDVVTRINFTAMEQPKKGGRPEKNAGRNKEDQATRFARNNFLKLQLRAAVMEGIALGDAYIWKGKVNREDAKTIIKHNFKEFGFELTDIELEEKALDEDYIGQKTLRYVAASTMNIELHDSGTKIKSYVQRVNLGLGTQTFPSATIRATSQGTIAGSSAGSPRKWNPEQIIHYKFMELDGKVHGFTPMQSNFPIIKTLGAIKDYHGHWFESGIMPDLIFNFEEDDANSVNHLKMTQLLTEWWNNKRRAPAVTTGKFKVEEFNKWNKDMEFRLLAIYYTGIIAFSVGMPLEKIRAILGGEIKSATGASDISNTDYQRNIYDMQDDWENLLNSQFFNEEFGVDMKFERSAARDEMAEVQRDEQKLNIFQKFQQMDLINKDNLVNLAEHLFPNLPGAWWNPNPKPEMEMGGMIPSSKAIPGQGKAAFSEEKKKQQLPQQKNNPPIGTKEIYEINFERFKQEVQEEKITPESRNRIEVEEKGNNFVLYLDPIGIDKTFKTTIGNDEYSKIESFNFGSISKKGKRVSGKPSIKEVYEIDFERFKHEVAEEKLTPQGRNRVEVEERNNDFVLHLTPIGINKTFKTTVTKAEYSAVDLLNFGPISKKGKRVS